MGKGPKQTLLQRGHTDGQQTYEKMLNITNHQRDASENHNELPSHACPIDNHQKINKQVLARMWRKGEPLCTVGGNIDWCSHYGKQYGVTTKN